MELKIQNFVCSHFHLKESKLGSSTLLDPSVFHPSLLLLVGGSQGVMEPDPIMPRAPSDTSVPSARSLVFTPIPNTLGITKRLSYATMLQQLADQERAKSCLVFSSKEVINFCRKPRYCGSTFDTVTGHDTWWCVL